MGNHTNHKNHTNHSSDNSLRAPSCPSWIIPVIPTAHPSFRRRPESRGARTAGHPTNHKNHTNHSSDNPLRAPSCPSWTIPVIPTAHPSFRRRPESRGAGTCGTSHQSQKSHESQFRQLPSRPFVSFVDNPRHSNRPPVIPAAAGIQRGGDVGNPTNHKNHSSDNPLRAPSCPSWTIPVIPTAHPSSWGRGGGNPTSFQPPSRPFVSFVDNSFGNRPPVRPTRHSGGGRNPEGRGRGESH